MEDVLSKISKNDLHELIGMCEGLGYEFDESAFVDMAEQRLQHLNSSVSDREESISSQVLENIWYESLEKGVPDYGVYDGVYYIACLWACWKKYSRLYLKNMINPRSMFDKSIFDDLGEINSVLDLGCGIGYTTAALKQMFPDCNVYGTNLKNSHQYGICEIMSSKFNFSICEDFSTIYNVGLVFASEYFEHFEKPVEHLISLIDQTNPKNIIFANAFTQKAIGHFDVYIHEDREYVGQEMSRLFSKTLREYGYQRVDTNCYNNRPQYYKLLANEI